MFECGVISTEYFGNSLGFGTRCEWDIYKSAPRQPVRMKFFFFWEMCMSAPTNHAWDRPARETCETADASNLPREVDLKLSQQLPEMQSRDHRCGAGSSTTSLSLVSRV